MKNVSAVIGSNYGDEGKGLLTDFLAFADSALVVRFNGGAQAGHTVVTPGGCRHVFHHLGSGTLGGSPTFLSKYFIANPMILASELIELRAKGFDRPLIFIDPECRVSTPFDALLNQAAEVARGTERHGSCGLGVWETVIRSENGFDLRVKDLIDEERLRIALNDIRHRWVPERREALGIKEAIPLLGDPGLLEHYIADVQVMLRSTVREEWGPWLAKKWDRLVFEGAQGLRLDQDNSMELPYVSASKTGIRNVALLMKEAEIKEELNVYYTTRPYLTRHGAGPLRNQIMFPSFKDDTNVTNPWQGDLRFAWHDIEDLAYYIVQDRTQELGIAVKPHLAVTCLDQVKDQEIVWFEHTDLKKGAPGDFISRLSRLTGIPMLEGLYCGGPTRLEVDYHRCLPRR